MTRSVERPLAMLAAFSLVACMSKPPFHPAEDGGGDGGPGGFDAGLCSETECPAVEPCFEGVCDGARVKELAAGQKFGCALLVSGSVHCWGANELGQLGNSEDVIDCGGIPCRHAPRRVNGLRKAIKLAAGGWTACVIQDDSTVACWGRSELGAIGHDPFADPPCAEGKSCSRTPVVIAGLDGVTALSLSEFSGCALRSDGTVRCWGLNRDGNIGDGTSGAEANAKLTPVTADIAGVRHLALSAHWNVHACAITESGLSCWGANFFGATGHMPFGTGDETCASGGPCTPAPTAVAGAANSADLFAASHVSCAVNSVGELRCWGACGHGITGTVECTELDSPTLIPGTPTPGGFASIAARYDHACGIQGQADRSIWCWGLNTRGELGSGDVGGEACQFGPCRRTFAKTDPALKGTPYPAHGRFTLAVDVDGVAWGWGSNDYGETGHPPATRDDIMCGPSHCNPHPVPIEGLPSGDGG